MRLHHLAWSLAAVTALSAAADIAVTASYRDLLSERSVAEHGFPFLTGAVLVSALLGAVIVSRFERHPIGWLLILVGSTGSLSLLGEAYSIWVLTAGGPGPDELAGTVGWLAALTSGQLAIGGLALILLLAPDGRLPSARWRWVPWAILTGELLYAAGLTAGDVTEFDIEATSSGPARGTLIAAGFGLIVVGLCAGLTSMLVRLRRSDGVRRQQLRLVAIGAALVLVGLVILVTAQAATGGRQTVATATPLFASFLLLPVLHAVAVLRYRLHDVEVIVNAALVVALGTAFAAAGYVAVVVAVRDEVDSRAGGWALSLAATVAVSLAFQPLRRWVVRVANRLAFGPRARPYEALADFSARLVEAPRSETLLAAVADAAGRAVSANGATATLHVPAGALSGRWGDPDPASAAAYQVPVRSEGHVLGSITVLLPKGRPVRPADVRLLEALADHAAMAFRNAAMERQLAARVTQLDRTTQQLRESRARLVDANNAARQALEAAISRDVLPPLAALPSGISRCRELVSSGAGGADLARLVDSTNAALESLRALTRGIFPTQLSRTGLAPSLRSCLAHAGLAPILDVDESAAGRRFAPRVESAVYFCVAEAVPGMSDRSSVRLAAQPTDLWVTLRGVSVDTVDQETIADRVAAVDGSLTVDEDGLTVRIPVGHAGSYGGDDARAQTDDSRSGASAALGM